MRTCVQVTKLQEERQAREERKRFGLSMSLPTGPSQVHSGRRGHCAGAASASNSAKPAAVLPRVAGNRSGPRPPPPEGFKDSRM